MNDRYIKTKNKFNRHMNGSILLSIDLKINRGAETFKQFSQILKILILVT